ncbi:MAG: hypothetical protein QY332_14450 [Anaerolineales bacterium]|nr:MAG: hypothetical protein QY332_14450 [Anaerolineales bacterium]
MKRTGVIAWAVLRLPLLAGGLYLFRFQVAAWIEDQFGLGNATIFAVYTASTFATRLLLYFVCVLGLTCLFGLLNKWLGTGSGAYLLFVAGASAAIYISLSYLLLIPDALWRTLPLAALLALNTLPHGWLAGRIPTGGLMNLVCLAGVGWMEAFFPQGYAAWLMDKAGARESVRKWSWLGGVLIAPLFWVFLLTPFDNQRILTLGEKLHADAAVRKFAQGEYNWIEFNTEHDLLYAVGRGTNFLLAFETERAALPARRSTTNIGKIQSFAFNPQRQEIYAYKADTQELLYLDALTLETFRAVPVADLSPGDIWVKWNPLNDSISIASEADVETGTPFVMIERASGEVSASLPLPLIPTNLALHTGVPRLYFNSFRDTYLVAWDMDSHEVTVRTQTSPRTDRLIYAPNSNEVLVASPLEGAILRYDAETLAYKGRIRTSLGDRTLTIDSKRDLLLVGNFINNRLTVIDMSTYETVASFYLGPWIRTIALDEERGAAYVSTVRALFRVEYAP